MNIFRIQSLHIALIIVFVALSSSACMRIKYPACVNSVKIDINCQQPDADPVCVDGNGTVTWEETGSGPSGKKLDFLIQFPNDSPFKVFGQPKREILTLVDTGKTGGDSPVKSGEFKYTIACPNGKKKDPMIKVPPITGPTD